MHAHLSKLESLGVLKRDPSKPRALEVMVERAKKAVRPSGLPLVGQVAAGEPILAEENIEDYLEVPDVVGGEDGDYILRVRGESMKDAGILEGDFVVVRPTERARDGEIVVALVGDEATVKRFFREKDQVRLQPENKSMKPIRTRDVRLLGRVVGSFQEGLVTVLAVEAETRLFEPSEVTLEDTILGAWEALTAQSRAECPVCHGELEPAAARPAAPRSPDAPHPGPEPGETAPHSHP